MSMSTGTWSDLSEQHEIRYRGNEMFLIITTSKISGVEGLYGFVFEVSGAKIR